MEKKPARHDLRMDATSYALLQAEAKRLHRTVNAHISFILEQHIESASLRKRAVRMEKAGLDAREATKQALGG